MNKDFYVVAYRDNKFYGAVSGLGRNQGTLDSSLSKRSARKYARELSLSKKNVWEGCTFKVETQIVDEVFGIFKGGIEVK